MATAKGPLTAVCIFLISLHAVSSQQNIPVVVVGGVEIRPVRSSTTTMTSSSPSIGITASTSATATTPASTSVASSTESASSLSSSSTTSSSSSASSTTATSPSSTESASSTSSSSSTLSSTEPPSTSISGAASGTESSTPSSSSSSSSSTSMATPSTSVGSTQSTLSSSTAISSTLSTSGSSSTLSTESSTIASAPPSSSSSGGLPPSSTSLVLEPSTESSTSTASSSSTQSGAANVSESTASSNATESVSSASATVSLADESTSPSVSESVSTSANSSSTSTIPTVVASGLVETAKPALGSVPTSEFDCSTVEPGYYGNPKVACDTKFYICVDREALAYEQRCPARLYYDAETKQCDMWAHIPACSGKSRPPIVALNETQFTLSPVPSVIDCYNLTDGNYPDPESTPKPFCSNRFFTCVGRREFRFRCPRGLFYDHERNQCDLFSRVFVCSGNRVLNETEDHAPGQLTLPPVSFDCRGKADGYYVENCDSVYYSCNGGLAREFRCPDGLVFDREWLSCEAPWHTFVCTGTQRPSTARPSSTSSRPAEVTTPSPLSCTDRKDGIFRDPEAKCSRIFYYCAHRVPFRNVCPGNLYFDDEFKRCDLWINVFDCSGTRPTTTLHPPSTTPKVVPVVDYDCSRLDDGNYVNPNNSCSQFFYICANMEAFQQYCPSGLYYNPDLNNCDSWSNIFACSGVTRKPTEATSPVAEGSTEKPEFDCSLKSDGVYTNAVNACSSVYFRCSGAIAFKFNCPAGLYYDATVDQCDTFDFVFACSGLSRPSPTPSTSRSSTGSTGKPPVDCRSLVDGDYADPSAKNACSRFFYTCSSGFAIRRECADGTYYDAELHSCDSFWKVPACTGSRRPSTTTSVPTTRGSSSAPPAFDCTKQYDGNYAAGDCTGDFWSCVGGTTFPRRCPMGFVYDAEFDDCEYPSMVPKCGGSRITVGSTVSTAATTPPGGFSCTFLADGNYVDPAAADGCSTIYYTCANGLTTRVHCPAGLYYDVVGNTCNSHDLVPACGGRSLSNSTLEPTTTTSISIPSTNASLAPVPISGASQSSVTSETTTHSVTTVVTPSSTTSSAPAGEFQNVTESSSSSSSVSSTELLPTSFSSSTNAVSAASSTSELVQNVTEATVGAPETTVSESTIATAESPSVLNMTEAVQSTSSSTELTTALNLSEAVQSTSASTETPAMLNLTEAVQSTSTGTEPPATLNLMETVRSISASTELPATLNLTEAAQSTSASTETPAMLNLTEAVQSTSSSSTEMLTTLNLTEAIEPTSTSAAAPALLNLTEPVQSPSVESINVTEISTTSERSTVGVSVANLGVSSTLVTVPSETPPTSIPNTTATEATLTYSINYR